MSGPTTPARPIVGAIRWDAWYGEGGPVAEVERSLGPRKFHFRLPFFAEVLSDATVRINGDRQAVMDQEIAYATAMGLDYWAFLDYWDDPRLSLALRRYLAAEDRRGLRYCLIEEGARLDQQGTAGWARLVRHFADPGYQLVLDRRPLLFVLAAPQRLDRDDFAALAAATLAAGLNRPYVVLMGWNPAADQRTAAAFGFDAVSKYGGGPYAGTMPSYQQVVAEIEQGLWGGLAAQSIPTVLHASAGWDTRPRIEHPVSWYPKGAVGVPDPTPPSRQQPLRDAVIATPGELAAHLRRALDWTRGHPALNPANAVIIYAWNEHDEGGWLCPTLKPDGSPDLERLEAVRAVLRGPARAGAEPR